MSNCNEQPDTYAVQLINAREVPVWEQATLPTETYIHASIKQYNPQTAADELNRYNIPVQDLLGLKTSADATVPKNGSEIKPVARQFVAAYISKNQPHAVTQGDGDHRAQFLIIGENANDNTRFDIKNSGVYVFTEGHDYNVIGGEYYMNDKGNIVTDPKSGDKDNQHLFTVLDSRTILIDMR